MNCPICNGALKINKRADNGELSYIRCEHQKTEKKGAEFVEVGKCKFKINFKTKLYTLNKESMKLLLGGEEIAIKDNNTLKMDINSDMFTTITFGDKYVEEDF